MPLDIAKLKASGVDLPVHFYGEQVTVNYDPFTVAQPAFRAEYERLRKQRAAAIREWTEAEPSTKKATDAQRAKRIWQMGGELVAMLIKDWDIIEAGEPLPVSADVFSKGTLPPELVDEILAEVWEDARTLGRNRKAT